MSDTLNVKTIGDRIEEGTIDRLDQLAPISDRGSTWHDAVVRRPIVAGDDIRVLDQMSIEPPTPVEVKGAARRISDGSGSRHGRWYIKADAHERLRAANGVYILVVYEGAAIDPLVTVAASAAAVEEHITAWSPARRDPVALVPWSRIISPEAIET